MGILHKWWILLNAAYSNLAIAAMELDSLKKSWYIKYKPYAFIIIFMNIFVVAMITVCVSVFILYSLFG